MNYNASIFPFPIVARLHHPVCIPNFCKVVTPAAGTRTKAVRDGCPLPPRRELTPYLIPTFPPSLPSSVQYLPPPTRLGPRLPAFCHRSPLPDPSIRGEGTAAVKTLVCRKYATAIREGFRYSTTLQYSTGNRHGSWAAQ